MRYCRYLDMHGSHYGNVEEVDGRLMVTQMMAPWPEDPYATWSRSAPFTPFPLEEATLLAPVVPGKIVCVGRNYKDHASELGNEIPKEPLLFFKPISSVIASGAEIKLPPASLTTRVDFEGELAVVIFRRCRNLTEQDDVRNYIRGYTIVNDVTARDLQKKDGQWTRAKGFDTFCPMGPIVSDELDPWAGVELATRLNGEEKQRGNTRQFIFDISAVIRYISQFMTLEPGDTIPTGTPSGVAPMKSGDTVEVEIDGLGVLRNTVA